MKIPSRGAADNPPNRFERLTVELEEPAERNPRTQFLRESARSIISRNDSPDISFSASLNPYRGCEHGCPYCYARPYHEYLGFSSGLDFETRIVVKENAAELLRGELGSPRWKPEVLAMSSITDCYQPVENRLGITRQCLQVLAEFRNPVGIITNLYVMARGTCSRERRQNSGAHPRLARRGAAFLEIRRADGWRWLLVGPNPGAVFAVPRSGRICEGAF